MIIRTRITSWDIEEVISELAEQAKYKEQVYARQCALYDRPFDKEYIKTTVENCAIKIIRDLQEKLHECNGI